MRNSPRLFQGAILLQALALAACQTEPGGQVASAAPNAGAPAEKKVCRDMMTTGSIGFRYICHTRSEWAQLDGQGSSVKQSDMPSTFMPHANAPGTR
ncbi:hypothetical protein ACUXST_002085 [Sphingomonas sp. F9_3S_D5_B_2]